MEKNRELLNMKDIEIDFENKIIKVLNDDRELVDIIKEMILREKIDESNYGKTFVLIYEGRTQNNMHGYWIRDGWNLIYKEKQYTKFDFIPIEEE